MLSLLYASLLSALLVLAFAFAVGVGLHYIERAAMTLWRRLQRG